MLCRQNIPDLGFFLASEMEGTSIVVLHSTDLAQTPGEQAIYMALQTSTDRELGCEQQTA